MRFSDAAGLKNKFFNKTIQFKHNVVNNPGEYITSASVFLELDCCFGYNELITKVCNIQGGIP